MQGINFSDDLRARGLRTPNAIKVNGDFNPGFGGPLVQGRIWFYSAARYLKAAAYVGDMFLDRTAKDLNVFTYNPDPGQRAFNDSFWWDASGRVTAQVTAKHKLGVLWSQQHS